MYKLYRHTSPSGKVYIGITCKKDVRRRWERGEGYRTQPFYNAIKKYGWENITHEVLYENLTANQAKKKEMELIKHYKELGLSYNVTDGGDCVAPGFGGGRGFGWKHSEETKKKIGDANRGNSNPYKGVPLSDEHKKKISEANKGKWGWNKGLHWDEEVKRKISESNKGKTFSDETKQKMREKKLGVSPANKGKKASESTKKLQSESKKKFYANNRVYWLHNIEGKTTRVIESKLKEMLDNGWMLGRK